MADVLLHEWEDYARPSYTGAYMAARPRAVAALAALLGRVALQQPAALAIDLEDVRAALRRAGSIGISSTTATGPGRANRLVPTALAASQRVQLGPAPAAPPTLALLCIDSHPAAELEMDELSEIIQTLQAALGPEVEIMFWHGDNDTLPATAVQLGLLLGYPAA